ncbi:MAG: hypothetical protein WCD00_15395 [Desulfuromonadaceae bacterium]
MEEKAIQTLREAISRHCRPSAVANMFFKALLAEGYSKSEILKITHTMETLMLGDEYNNNERPEMEEAP